MSMPARASNEAGIKQERPGCFVCAPDSLRDGFFLPYALRRPCRTQRVPFDLCHPILLVNEHDDGHKTVGFWGF
jgi:hypothetical protein